VKPTTLQEGDDLFEVIFAEPLDGPRLSGYGQAEEKEEQW
jgi:hypothetical protein